MGKLSVDKGKCIGCGACVAVDSKHFDFSDEGYSEAISQEDLGTEELKSAIESCPTGAISIECDCPDDCDCGCKDGKECTCGCQNGKCAK